jgi:hypothetical protein
MRPHDVGFNEFCGFYPTAKESTQQLDKRRYPDLVLNRVRGGQYPCLQGQKVEEVSTIGSIEDMAEGDLSKSVTRSRSYAVRFPSRHRI